MDASGRCCPLLFASLLQNGVFLSRSPLFLFLFEMALNLCKQAVPTLSRDCISFPSRNSISYDRHNVHVAKEFVRSVSIVEGLKELRDDCFVR